MSHSTSGHRLAQKRCRTPFWKDRQRGLTLLELVVVLGILAILAGVTIQSLEPIADQARYDATARTLEAIERAIYQEQQAAADRTVIRGFVADMGRLPLAMSDDPAHQASELWSAAHLSSDALNVGLRGFTDPEVDEIQVGVAAGWNGPYLQLPANQRLLDGWGRPFAFRPGGLVLLAGEPIVTAQSAGADGVFHRGVTAADDLVVSRNFDSQFFSSVEFRLMERSSGSISPAEIPESERLYVFVYGPRDGMASRLYPPLGDGFEGDTHSSNEPTLTIEIDPLHPERNLTVGPRTIVAALGNGGSPGELTISWSQSLPVNLFPGNNVITMVKPAVAPTNDAATDPVN